ncbi:hypothetical protein IC575_013498 [Cucumis melo]
MGLIMKKRLLQCSNDIIRSLLAIAAAKQWPLLQMDVKNAFLNGTLSEEVYMKPPPGTTPPPQKVCLLRRALYGLKQAPRAWFATFSSTITQLGFTSSSHDSALFTRQTPNGIVLLLLYVDDMIITGDDPQAISDLQCYLGKHFEMKDLGNLNYFLGLEISSSSSGYYLSQAKYRRPPQSIRYYRLRHFLNTSDPNVRLTPFDGVPLEDPTLYRQLVGSLIYLTVTRPDIAYAVHIVSQFMAAPRTIHFTAVLRILRYIKGTLGHGLQFSSQSSLVLSGFSDADWAGDPTDRRSTTGYCFYLGDALISGEETIIVSVPTSPNIVQVMLLELIWCVGFFRYGAPGHHPLFFIVIITVLFRLHTMMYSMNEQSILRMTVTLFATTYRATHFISNPSLPPINLRIYSPKLSILLVSLS